MNNTNSAPLGEVVTNVLTTKNYDMFNHVDGNRIVNKLHVRRLRESFKTKYLLSPIIVNSRFQIIDGQHRFNAAKELGLPINYIICPDYQLKEVQLLNTNSKNWKREDYLNAFCDLGYEQYIAFRKFKNRYPEYGIENCMALLTNTSSTSGSGMTKLKDFKSESNKDGQVRVRKFEEGNFIIKDFDYACEMADNLRLIKPYYSGYNRRFFVLAMIGIFKNEKYSHEQFIARLTSCPIPLEARANVTQQKLLIEEIYNYRSRDKISLRY
jgi:hypothetical protein